MCLNQVKISFKVNKNNWYPEEQMDIKLLAEENSLICLVGGRGTENISPSRSVLYTFSIKKKKKHIRYYSHITLNYYFPYQKHGR